MTVVSGSSITCTPAALPQATVSYNTYQFCYQAYAAAAGGVPAWQVAIAGTIQTRTCMQQDISGQTGYWILDLSGTRYQTVNGAGAWCCTRPLRSLTRTAPCRPSTTSTPG